LAGVAGGDLAQDLLGRLAGKDPMMEHEAFGFGPAGDARDVARRGVKRCVLFLPRRGARLQADFGVRFVHEPIGAAGLLDPLRGERGVSNPTRIATRRQNHSGVATRARRHYFRSGVGGGDY
jgi:hypothetical protein